MNDIRKKFKSLADMQNFCREQNSFFPMLPMFDSHFFLQYLNGTKELLKLGQYSTSFSFRYYTKEKLFTKEHLWNIIKQKPNLLRFFPDEINVEALDRDFLFSVLATNDQATWLALYNEYKEKQSTNASTRWDIYGLEINEDVAKAIETFVTSANHGSGKIFRTSKKGVRNDALIDVNNRGNNQGGGANLGNNPFVQPNQNQNQNNNNNNFQGSGNSQGNMLMDAY